MFDKDTLTIAEIIKATPDAVGDYYDFPMKLFKDLSTEAAKRNISPYVLESALNRLPQQGLAKVFHSQVGSVYGIVPSRMLLNLFP